MGITIFHYAGSHSYLVKAVGNRAPSFGFAKCCSPEQQVSHVSRLKSLEKLDSELAKGDDESALSLVMALQAQPGGLRCFGAARQVLVFAFTLSELFTYNILIIGYF